MQILIKTCKQLKRKSLQKSFKFNNKKNLSDTILVMKNNLRRMAHA